MEEKIKFQQEYSLQASASLLYQYLSTSSGLSEWFADNVSSQGNKFVFLWAGYPEEAFLIARRQDKLVRFRWAEDSEKYYFEVRIEEDELTGDVSLIVTDFSLPGELNESKQLWDRHINDLKKAIGA